MQSLESDLLPRDPEEAARIYGIRPLPLRPRGRAGPQRVGVARAAGGAMRVERTTHIAAARRRSTTW